MIALLFIIFFGLIFLRVPVGFSLAASSLVVVIFQGIPPTIVALRLYEGLGSFPVIAIPLFYVLGMLCNEGGFTERIMLLARVIVGGVRSGLAQINIVASMLFAGVSGSSTADVAGIGSIIMPQMVKAGYSKSFAVAVTACSATLGNIIPPSLLMVIYGAFGNVSIGMLFLGGVVPGILIGAGQMILVYFVSKKYGFGLNDQLGERPNLLQAIKAGAAPFGIPVIIIGGIVGGVFTPTESASIALTYVLLLSVLVYRELTLNAFIRLLRDAGEFVSVVLIMTAAASVFGWLLAYNQFPTMVVDVMGEFGTSPILVLLAVAVLFIILGMFMDLIPAIIMFLPVIQAMGNSAGIHPVQLGCVVVLTVTLGFITPPYATGLLVASRIIGIHQRNAIGMTLLFGGVGLTVIILAILFPDITLFLPRLLMPRFY